MEAFDLIGNQKIRTNVSASIAVQSKNFRNKEEQKLTREKNEMTGKE